MRVLSTPRCGGGVPVAVGICAPGPLDAAAGVLIDPPNLRGEWRGLALGADYRHRLGLPWAMERDTNVAVLGERDYGAGQRLGDLVYLTISTAWAARSSRMAGSCSDRTASQASWAT